MRRNYLVESNNYDSSSIKNYEDKIDWDEVCTLEFCVYQFDENDTEFEDEGDCVKCFYAEDYTQFEDAQNKAITYANKLTEENNTPCSVVLIGYDENEDSLDEYWDTIYYVKPFISTEGLNRKLHIKEDSRDYYRSK